MDKLLILDQTKVFADGRSIFSANHIEIPMNGMIALVGPNGAGKTTLLRLIHGLIKPDAGSCVSPFDKHESALVLHYTPMLKASVREHLKLLRDTNIAVSDADIDQALARVGLSHLANNPAQKLSAGERQKLCFARARLQNPKLVMLDEPTANLDPNASDDVEAMMTQLAQESKVVIFASHNMAQVQRLANTVLFMQDGQILEIATPEQFFKNPQSKEATKFLAREFIAQ
ncbi:MAG: ABC transporter ATP-binding protein [Burkholderiaceae bacterium]|jgi:tungstate transport system ATP-binding protein|nr:ABC transporter ATP-binding protein [Burkholderiaceae bacterium]NBS10435.1 ABC transporter ATP-binding protein [Burkholderiaceae bacterium]